MSMWLRVQRAWPMYAARNGHLIWWIDCNNNAKRCNMCVFWSRTQVSERQLRRILNMATSHTREHVCSHLHCLYLVLIILYKRDVCTYMRSVNIAWCTLILSQFKRCVIVCKIKLQTLYTRSVAFRERTRENKRKTHATWTQHTSNKESKSRRKSKCKRLPNICYSNPLQTAISLNSWTERHNLPPISSAGIKQLNFGVQHRGVNVHRFINIQIRRGSMESRSTCRQKWRVIKVFAVF